jgi:hypothetical protein
VDESSHPVAALIQEPTQLPESPEHGDEADAVCGSASARQPAERSPEIIVLALKFVQASGPQR